MSTAPAGPDTAGSLFLTGDDWQVLQELLPGLRLPADFESQWDLLAGEDQVAAARAASLAHLRGRGLITAEDEPHPAMRTALAMFGMPALHVRVRSWDRDLAVLAELAVGPGSGVGLARLQRVETVGGRPAVVREGPLVELSVFPASETLQAIRRTLPPIAVPGGPERGPTRGSGPGPARAREPAMFAPWEDALALADALARSPAHDPDSTEARLDSAVLELLLEQAGLTEVPPILADVATSLTGAIEVTLVTGTGAGRIDLAAPTWLGRWLVAGDRIVGLTLAPAPPDPAATQAPPDPGHGARLGLLPADATSVSEDLLSALTAAFTVQNRLLRTAASRNGSSHG